MILDTFRFERGLSQDFHRESIFLDVLGGMISTQEKVTII